MSRQNKNRRIIDQRKQTTKLHKASVTKHGMKRTKQPKKQRHSVGFTKKLTSIRKGRCIIKKGEKD